MGLEDRLANELVQKHPERAAAALERLDPDAVSAVLRDGEAEHAAALLERLSPVRAEAVLERLERARVAEIFECIGNGAALRLARRLDPERREGVLAELPDEAAGALRTALRFPEHTAGALMDPTVLALSEGFTAKEALERVREAPARAHYNLYVIDGDWKLVGVLNLRELFLARPAARLRDIMIRTPQALDARADRIAIVAHPGWREVHSLPVVDDDGTYLGAVRYRTLRDLEDLLLRGRRRDSETPQALGQLFAAGASGLLDALAGASASPGGEA